MNLAEAKAKLQMQLADLKKDEAEVLHGLREICQRERKMRGAVNAAKIKAGMLVRYQDETGKFHMTTATSEPWQLGDRTWVVKIAGKSGGYDCAKVEPLGDVCS